MWNGGYGGWGWVGWMVTAVVLVVVFAVVLTAITGAVRYLSSSRERRTADDVLAERYARGEINDEQYRQGLALLREHR